VEPSPLIPAADGGFALRLSAHERNLLRRLPVDLRALLESDSDDPGIRRLFPPAYDDDEAEAEFRGLMHDDLLDSYRDALAVLEGTADSEHLRRDDVDAWLAALNALRLVLGTRLGVSEDLYERKLDPGELASTELGVYVYLTWLQEECVQAVSSRRNP
jgi:hypothetical protein